jgi:hypothetical protein
MDRIITAQEAKQICYHERLMPTFRRIHSACIHCVYEIKGEALYNQDIEKLVNLGFKVKITREYGSEVCECNISWL